MVGSWSYLCNGTSTTVVLILPIIQSLNEGMHGLKPIVSIL